MAFFRTGIGGKDVANPKVYMQEIVARKKYTTLNFTLAKGDYVMYLYAFDQRGSSPYMASYDNITALTGATSNKLADNRYALNVPTDGDVSITFESGNSDATGNRTAYILIIF